MRKLFLQSSLACIVVPVMALGFYSAISEPVSKRNPVTGPQNIRFQNVKVDYAKLADSLRVKLYRSFLSPKGTYFKNIGGDDGLYYWPNAHALDILIDAYERTGNKAYLPKMKALLNGIKAANGNTFSNWYYDDMAWLANACLRAYVLTKDVKYLSVTNQLYADIKSGYNSSQGGGITWRKGEPGYKNIPSTGNVCILAARLYQIKADAKGLAFAKSLFNWMQKYMVNAAGQVQNGVNRQNDGKMDDWVFTYNQGLFIGSAVEMYNVTKENTYLQSAIKTANNALTDTALTTNGYLKSEGPGDHGLFKGVLVRYFTLLTELPDLDKANRTKYALFLQRNAQYLATKGIARPSMIIGPDWGLVTPQCTELTTQLSGMIMMEAAAKLQAAGKIQ